MTTAKIVTSNYNNTFYEACTKAEYSSHVIVKLLLGKIPNITSVLDLGCALGTWLKVWHANGVENIYGIDGTYVVLDQLEIDKKFFEYQDLNKSVAIGRKFSLAMSLEEGEHLQKQSASTLVKSLCDHADIVLFSAAPPGQGGEYHINEQPYEFWRELFRQQNFLMFDSVRPYINDHNVFYWYRYNSFIFIKSGHPYCELLANDRIDESLPVPDLSPTTFKVRKFFVRMLPVSLQNYISRFLQSIRK